MVDVKTLERISDQLQLDAGRGWNLNNAAMRNISDIIRDAIGAPLVWPSRVAGCDAANEEYPGSPSERLAFNAGVKWAVEHYSPSVSYR